MRTREYPAGTQVQIRWGMRQGAVIVRRDGDAHWIVRCRDGRELRMAHTRIQPVKGKG